MLTQTLLGTSYVVSKAYSAWTCMIQLCCILLSNWIVVAALKKQNRLVKFLHSLCLFSRPLCVARKLEWMAPSPGCWMSLRPCRSFGPTLWDTATLPCSLDRTQACLLTIRRMENSHLDTTPMAMAKQRVQKGKDVYWKTWKRLKMLAVGMA